MRQVYFMMPFFLLLSTTARAQLISERDPLEVPTGGLTCRPVAVGAKEPAAFTFEMSDIAIAEFPRRLVYAFDVAGAPLYATIMSASAMDSGRAKVDILVARLAPERSGSRLRVLDGALDTAHVLSAAPDASLAPGEIRLTDAELSRMLTLGHWLWSHRCAARPVGS